jgi:hypothetical protein
VRKKKKNKKKKVLKIIPKSGVSYRFLLFFTFFHGDQAEGKKKNGRNGKFFWTFDTENMNQSVPVSNKTPGENSTTAGHICPKYDKEGSVSV